MEVIIWIALGSHVFLLLRIILLTSANVIGTEKERNKSVLNRSGTCMSPQEKVIGGWGEVVRV